MRIKHVFTHIIIWQNILFKSSQSQRSNWNVPGEKVKLKCARWKGQIEMCPVKRSNWNVPGKKSDWNVSCKKVKLKCKAAERERKGQLEPGPQPTRTPILELRRRIEDSSHQGDIRMRSHRLLRLDDNKSAASCPQAWCKLIVKTFYPQARCKLFQTTYSKSVNFKLNQVWFSQSRWN